MSGNYFPADGEDIFTPSDIPRTFAPLPRLLPWGGGCLNFLPLIVRASFCGTACHVLPKVPLGNCLPLIARISFCGTSYRSLSGLPAFVSV